MLKLQTDSKIITVEGNIGSGKSTLLKLINDKIENVQILKEPVCEWQQINGNPRLNLLEQFYNDPKRWGYTFQSFAYFSRVKQWSENQLVEKYAIAERSVLSDKYIFAQNGKQSGFFTEIEWAIYVEYFDWLVKQFKADQIDGVIYLSTEPQTCLERIGKRGRSEEKNTIPIEYLNSLHDRHEEWLGQNNQQQFPILKINGNQDFVSDDVAQASVINQINQFLSSN